MRGVDAELRGVICRPTINWVLASERGEESKGDAPHYTSHRHNFDKHLIPAIRAEYIPKEGQNAELDDGIIKRIQKLANISQLFRLNMVSEFVIVGCGVYNINNL